MQHKLEEYVKHTMGMQLAKSRRRDTIGQMTKFIFTINWGEEDGGPDKIKRDLENVLTKWYVGPCSDPDANKPTLQNREIWRLIFLVWY